MNNIPKEAVLLRSMPRTDKLVVGKLFRLGEELNEFGILHFSSYCGIDTNRHWDRIDHAGDDYYFLPCRYTLSIQYDEVVTRIRSASFAG